ncbi:MAG: hypothetical protein OS130_02430 [Thermodesulfobacteriota bacterium]|jgi:hypothetical protein|nr:MAG: hypothetical protein OS130_02430 [Thermodesulfobacteriota bacterium]
MGVFSYFWLILYIFAGLKAFYLFSPLSVAPSVDFSVAASSLSIAFSTSARFSSGISPRFELAYQK